MSLTINILPVGTGDAIHISYLGNDGELHNILIDGGYVGSYKRGLKEALKRIADSGQKIDLCCISHIDSDHIGAILAFLRDSDFSSKTDFVKSWWLNHDLTISDNNSLISIGQGRKVKDFLVSGGKLYSNPITTDGPPFSFSGARITILSPDLIGYQQMSKFWDEGRMKSPLVEIASSANDYSIPIEQFATKFWEVPYIEDTATANGSSIAFLFTLLQFNILFLADAHPSTIVNSLHIQGYSKMNPCKADFLKVAHHGSKFNTSPDLLDLIDVQNFIFSADGIGKDRLPNKECLARILLHPNRDMSKKILFYFNHDNHRLRSIFDVDDDPFNTYNFDMIFPQPNVKGISINIP